MNGQQPEQERVRKATEIFGDHPLGLGRRFPYASARCQQAHRTKRAGNANRIVNFGPNGWSRCLLRLPISTNSDTTVSMASQKNNREVASHIAAMRCFLNYIVTMMRTFPLVNDEIGSQTEQEIYERVRPVDELCEGALMAGPIFTSILRIPYPSDQMF